MGIFWGEGGPPPCQMSLLLGPSGEGLAVSLWGPVFKCSLFCKVTCGLLQGSLRTSLYRAPGVGTWVKLTSSTSPNSPTPRQPVLHPLSAEASSPISRPLGRISKKI